MTEQITSIQYKLHFTIPSVFAGVLILVLICIFMLKHENRALFLEHSHFSLTSVETSHVKGMLDQKVVATVSAC